MPNETQVHVVFSVPLHEGETEDEARRELTAWIDERLRRGTYEVVITGARALPTVLASGGRYATLKELNAELRQIALRTLSALDGLGLGRRGSLWDTWQRLAQQDPLDEHLDDRIRRKLDQLGVLGEVLGKALGAIDAFDSAKRDLERVWEGVDREIENARREASPREE